MIWDYKHYINHMKPNTKNNTQITNRLLVIEDYMSSKPDRQR